MSEFNKKIAVLGGGSWATAIVKILSNNLSKINWWIRDKEVVDYIQQYKHNPKYLSSVELDPDKLNVSDDLQKIVDDSDVLIIVIPSAFLYQAFENTDIIGIENKIIISAVKGIVPEHHAIPARYFHKRFNIPYEKIGMIAGPCHAEEVAMEKLSYLTMVCQDLNIAEYIAKAFACRYIKTQTSEDLFGTELSAILKNVYAIASGICHGLGYGDNFQAILIANALRETERFIDAVNPIHRDVKSSAYLGDLLVTGYSQFSRNRNFGNMIGKGYSVKSAHIEMNMVAEGYYAVKSIFEMNKKFNVEMPILDAVYRIVYENVTPVVEMRILTDKLS
ncbi:MAG: NAD(P)H-dependent glycerol-3-phosphate dehydrogenase [Vicingaceae bacterium]